MCRHQSGLVENSAQEKNMTQLSSFAKKESDRIPSLVGFFVFLMRLICSLEPISLGAWLTAGLK
jgi:hypothetical protein